MEGVAGRISALREQRGWTQADLAARAGVSAAYISRLEAGDYTRPSAVKLGAIASALGVRLVDITGQEPRVMPRTVEEITQELQPAVRREREQATLEAWTRSIRVFEEAMRDSGFTDERIDQPASIRREAQRRQIPWLYPPSRGKAGP